MNCSLRHEAILINGNVKANKLYYEIGRYGCLCPVYQDPDSKLKHADTSVKNCFYFPFLISRTVRHLYVNSANDGTTFVCLFCHLNILNKYQLIEPTRVNAILFHCNC